MKTQPVRASILVFITFLTSATASVCGAVNHLAFNPQQPEQGLWFEFKSDNEGDWLTQFSEPHQELSRTALLLDQKLPNYTLHWGMATSEHQDMSQIGISYSDMSFYGFSGQGDTVSTVFSPFDRIDKFHFHGGLHQQFDYSGLHVGYGVAGGGRIGFTHAAIDAPGLSRRSVSEISWQGMRFHVSLMQVDENSQFAGRVLTAGVRTARHQVSINRLEADNEAEYTGMSITGRNQSGTDWAIHLDHRTNPLYQDANENRITFTLGYKFARRFSAMRAAETDTGAGQKNKNTGWLVGAGAVGAALAMSSGGGNGGSDDRPRFESQQMAARQVLNEVNPISIAQNREWGGYVYRNADGSYSSTNAIRGNATSLLLPAPDSAAPSGAMTTASYHTHAAFDPRYDNENFSPQDILSDELFDIDGYLATPRGQFKYHDVRKGRVITLGGPGAIATGG